MAQSKLVFSKVIIASFSRRPDGGSAKISCAPSKSVAKAMGWGELPEWQKSSVASGALKATIVEFTPTHSDHAKHAFDLATTAVRDFEFVRVQVKKGKTASKSPSFRLELHFTIDFSDPQGARKIEQYWVNVVESSMRVTYEPKAEQEELPMQDDQQKLATSEKED